MSTSITYLLEYGGGGNEGEVEDSGGATIASFFGSLPSPCTSPSSSITMLSVLNEKITWGKRRMVHWLSHQQLCLEALSFHRLKCFFLWFRNCLLLLHLLVQAFILLCHEIENAIFMKMPIDQIPERQ